MALFLAGIAVPYLIILWTLHSIFSESPYSLGYLANTMFFFVGWHYIKQIMGCVTVTSALKGFYYTKQERISLLTNLSCLWGISFLRGNMGSFTRKYHSISYKTFSIPPIFLKITYAVLAISFLLIVFQMIKKYIDHGRWPPFVSIIAFSSIYVWYIPLFRHSSFAIMIPFFHSLQYLPFAYAYAGNRHRALCKNQDPSLYRKKMVTKLGFYIGLSFITGALFFRFIPQYLDRYTTYDKALFSPELFMFSFVIFLNIHHYFIDFAIWRKSNDNVRKYLLQSPGS